MARPTEVKSRAGLWAALFALVVLTSGCGAEGATPVPTTNPPTTTSATSGPLTTIPPDLRLPHEDSWAAGDPGLTDVLPEMCIDPPPDLLPPKTTAQRDLHGTAADGTTRSESLGLFSDSRSAHGAVEAWRGQTAACGHGLNHVGSPQDWIVREVIVNGTDEAWQGHDAASGTFTTFTTVVRVGNAVYVERSRQEGRVGGSSIAATIDAEIAAVAAYVPALSVFDR